MLLFSMSACSERHNGSVAEKSDQKVGRRKTTATVVRGHRRRKSRSAAYFFAEPGLGLAFAFGLGTLSAGFVCLAVFGFRVEPFGLVFFAMMSSCFCGVGTADRRDWIGRSQSRLPGNGGCGDASHRQRKERRKRVALAAKTHVTIPRRCPRHHHRRGAVPRKCSGEHRRRRAIQIGREFAVPFLRPRATTLAP